LASSRRYTKAENPCLTFHSLNTEHKLRAPLDYYADKHNAMMHSSVMKFVDRNDEMKRLDRVAMPGHGGLVVIWGRRRVGKTRLLLEWSGKHHGIYSVADQSAPAVQRRYFADAMSAKFEGFDQVEYRDWKSLLQRITSEAERMNWRGAVILDEFPYLVGAETALPSMLQNWVDRDVARTGLTVVVAGSSQRMMQGLALDHDAPLYGRAVEAFEVRPIPAGYLGEALRIGDAVDCVKGWCLWGGIPRYWELAAPFGGNWDAAVDALALDPAAPLHLEPDRLLREEGPSAIALRPILDVIGLGAERPSEVAGRIGQPVTSLARPLARLVELGLVKREVPFGESEKGGRRALYRIHDPFMRFWFAVVAGHRGYLAESNPRSRLEIWHKSRQRVFSFGWEELCRECMPRLAVAGHPLSRQAGGWGPAQRSWSAHGPEWDIMARAVDGKSILCGEVKWHEKTFSGAQLSQIGNDLVRKGTPPLKKGEGITYAVFVPRAREKMIKCDGRNIHVVNAESVLAALR
jgi:AAA+ ATPase superfamily predicted ATPase